MDNNYKQINDAMVEYAVSTNKQVYEFGTKMVRDYMDFSRNIFKMFPAIDVSWLPKLDK